MEKPNIAQNESRRYFKQMFPIESRMDLKFNHWGLISIRALGWDEQTLSALEASLAFPSEWEVEDLLTWLNEPVLSLHTTSQSAVLASKPRAAQWQVSTKGQLKLHKETLSASPEVPRQDICRHYTLTHFWSHRAVISLTVFLAPGKRTSSG